MTQSAISSHPSVTEFSATMRGVSATRRKLLLGLGVVGVLAAAGGGFYMMRNRADSIVEVKYPPAVVQRVGQIREAARSLNRSSQRRGDAQRILDGAGELQVIYGSDATAPVQDAVARAAHALLSDIGDHSPAAAENFARARFAMSVLTDAQQRVALAQALIDRSDMTPQGILQAHTLLYSVLDDATEIGAKGSRGLLGSATRYFARAPGEDSLEAALLCVRMFSEPEDRARLSHRIAVERLAAFGAQSTLVGPLQAGKLDGALMRASWKATNGKRTGEAAILAMAIADSALRDRMLAQVAEGSIDHDTVWQALPSLLAMTGNGARDTALLRFVRRSQDDLYLHEAAIAAQAIENREKRAVALTLVAETMADSGYRKRADYFLSQAGDLNALVPGGARDSALSYAALTWARLGDIDKAEALLSDTQANMPERDAAAIALANAKANAGRDPAEIQRVAAWTSDAGREDVIAIAADQAANASHFAAADSMIATLPDADARLRANARLAFDHTMSSAWLQRARLDLGAAVNVDKSGILAAFDISAGQLNPARQRLALIFDPDLRAAAITALSRKLTDAGKVREAVSLISMLDSEDTKGRDAIRSAVALTLARKNRIVEAARLVRAMENPIKRTSTYRSIATIEARRNDNFDALDGARLAEPKGHDGPASQTRMVRRASFDIYGIARNDLGQNLPTLPNAIGITPASVQSQVPEPTAGRLAHALVTPMANNGYNKKFLTASDFSDVSLGGPSIVMKAQTTTYPVYMHIAAGTMDMPTLYERMVLSGNSHGIVRTGRKYLLRVPIFVATGATLSVTDDDVSEVRLSTERAAYIVNAGRTYFSGVTLVGWDEQHNAPVEQSMDTAYEFKPFYLGWSNSETFATHTRFVRLGSHSSKAYGFSLSGGPLGLMSAAREKKDPSGIVVENSFEKMFYGFYSWEAGNVALIGNEYRDNLIYGIDPHDRSHELLVAFNTAYGSEKKHGIIGSRHVEGSWFFGNLSFGNHGSGLMLDRFSGRNLLYANTAFDNGGNGISLYESPCNLISSNHLFANHGSGVFYRNSWDVGVFRNDIAGNGKQGVLGFADKIVTKPGAPERNLQVDPYEMYTSSAVVGNVLRNNVGGGIAMRGVGSGALRSNAITGTGRKAYLGDLSTIESDIARSGSDGVSFSTACTRPKIQYACPFAEQGFVSRQLDMMPVAVSRFATCPPRTTVNEDTDPAKAQSWQVAWVVATQGLAPKPTTGRATVASPLSKGVH